ncbi:MAG: hypothetical protein HGA78_05365 [Nitrospirales bacterium]|nr:hypothetical protein [Nitrospirales bacterium]
MVTEAPVITDFCSEEKKDRMERGDAVNRLRTLHYLAGILNNQQHDPFCRGCVAFSRSVEAVRGKVSATPLPSALVELSALSRRIQEMLDSISVPEKTEGQKRAGRCLMPEGACFPKYAMAFLRKMEGDG